MPSCAGTDPGPAGQGLLRDGLCDPGGGAHRGAAYPAFGEALAQANRVEIGLRLSAVFCVLRKGAVRGRLFLILG